MKGACLVDDNGSLYGILVHPLLKITKIDISRHEYRNEMKKERTQLEDVVHVQWDELEATVSREFMAGNDMETQGQNSFESGNVSVEQKQQQRRSRQSANEALNRIDRHLLAIGRTYLSIENETKMIKRNRNADVYAYQIKATKDKFTKIEVRISELNASVDPLTVAGISAYQRQIDRVIGHLTVKTKEIIEQVASNAKGHTNRHDNVLSLNPIAENGDADHSEDDNQDANFLIKRQRVQSTVKSPMHQKKFHNNYLCKLIFWIRPFYWHLYPQILSMPLKLKEI